MAIINVVPKDFSASNSQSSNQPMSAKERAISAFNKGMQAQESAPVADPSKVSPEEMGAIKAPSAEGQNNTSEEASAPASEVTDKSAKAEEPALSAQFAQLARKERALRAKAQEIKAQEAASKAQLEKMAQLEARLAKFEADEKAISEDPFNFLTKRGVTYDQITQRALNAPSAEEQASQAAFEKLQAEIQQIKEAQDQAKQNFENQQKQQYEQAVNQIRSQAKQLITADANYETIKETNSVEDVVDLIKLTFEKDGVLMTVEEAALAVEEHLLEEAMKLTKLKKIQARMKPAEQKAAEKLPESDKQPQKTLTNNLTATKPLSARERAILAFNNKLNK